MSKREAEEATSCLLETMSMKVQTYFGRFRILKTEAVKCFKTREISVILLLYIIMAIPSGTGHETPGRGAGVILQLAYSFFTENILGSLN